MEYTSPWGGVTIPGGTLHDLIFTSLTDEDRQKVAFDHAETGQVLTFGEVSDGVDAVATWLAHHGFGKGATVAIAMHNRPEWGIGFHGILRAGATVTPVNTASAALEIGRQLRITSASAIVTEPPLLPMVREACAEAGRDVRIIVVGDCQEDQVVPWQELLDTPPDPPQLQIDPATDIACLPMSSGTSGLPKAVMISHRNLVANVSQFGPIMQAFGTGNSMAVFLPYSHIFALSTNLNYCLLNRLPQYTMTSFQAHLLFEIVQTRRPTIVFVVPPVAAFLARSPAVKRVDWSCLRAMISGASVISPGICDALEENLGVRVTQGYGMTEMSPVTHMVPLERPDIHASTLGWCIPEVAVRIVDLETGEDVEQPGDGGWSKPGELLVKGPNMMLGYLDDPESTAQAITEDGWLRTGDLVEVDHRGVARVVDRIKELIKRRGFQIPPAELEGELVLHPLVADAAVVGLGAAAGDQIPHALLVLAPGADPQTAPVEILKWLNARIAQYKHVPSATVVEQLPRSAAGKLVRRQLLALVG